VDGAQLALHDVIRIQSLAFDQLSFRFSLTFGASFEDLFEIRGMMRKLRGDVHQPEWRGRCLDLGYKGADGIHRSTSIRFSATPVKAGTTCTFDVHLKPNETSEFSVSALIAETPNRTRRRLVKRAKGELDLVDANVNDGWATWLEDGTEVHTNSLSLNGVLKRSFLDLNMLRSYIGNEEYFAAGVPWFVALFGRDSIITALQMLAYDSRIAEHTILLLAALQGRQIDHWRDEEPGKIPHELRVGEMANLKEVPHTPYYGTVDATPLFLILIGRHAAWTGELALFNAVRPNIDAALDWISRSCALSACGYLEYKRTTEAGLANQGWKDSTDAVVNPDGTLASPPIAMVEVQAYVYQAKMEMAALFRLAGDIDRADRLQREADELRQRFNNDFWGDDGLYALALQNGGTRAAVMSSNAGHALWTGIADPLKARRTVERMMAEDMFNGWGIRTLSVQERRYNPLGYHLGTVWPHDNSLIVAGMRSYGFDEEALAVFLGLLEAASFFDEHRLPELFAGFSKREFGVPVTYPVACQPQAWAAASIPYMFTTLLGLIPEAFDHRLRIRHPIIPDFMNEVEIRRLRVGDAEVDLKFERALDTIAVKVLNLEGRLEVVVEL
jgi:glycogen debranching enzyme